MLKGLIKRCLAIADNNSDDEYKSIAYIEIYKTIKQLELKINSNVIKKKAYGICEDISNTDIKARSYICIAMIFLEINEYDEASKSYSKAKIHIDQLNEQNDKDYALKEISKLEVTLGKTDIALVSAMKISGDWWRAEAIAEISKSFMRFNNLSEALKVTRVLKQKFMRSEAIQNIVMELVYKNEINEGLKLIDDIKDNGFKNNTLVKIIKELSIKGNLIDAERLISRIDDTEYVAIAWKEILGILYRNASFESFYEIAIKSMEVSTSLFSKEEFYLNLLLQLNKNELLNSRNLAMTYLKSDYFLSKAYFYRIKYLLDQRDIKQSYSLIENIPYSSFKLESCILILKSAISVGKKEFVDEIEDAILKLLHEESELRIKAIRSKELECFLRRSALDNKAVKFSNIFKDSFKEISDSHDKIGCLASISSVLKDYDYIEEAQIEMNEARDMAKEFKNDWPLFMIAENLVEQNEIELAVKIANENLSENYKHEIFTLAVESYASQKKFNKAHELIDCIELSEFRKKSLRILGKSFSLKDICQFRINETVEKTQSIVKGFVLDNAYSFSISEQKCIAPLLLVNDVRSTFEYLYHLAAKVIFFIDSNFDKELHVILSEVLELDEWVAQLK